MISIDGILFDPCGEPIMVHQSTTGVDNPVSVAIARRIIEWSDDDIFPYNDLLIVPTRSNVCL